MESVPLLDCAGRRRSPATLTSFHLGQPPRNKRMRYPADPPTVEEIIAVMRPNGMRLRELIIVPLRSGLRISEAQTEREKEVSDEATYQAEIKRDSRASQVAMRAKGLSSPVTLLS